MKKKKSYNEMSVLFRVIFFQVISLFLLFCFGCEDETKEDLSIGEITVYNLPDNINVYDSDAKKYKEDVTHPAFKIYLNASNSDNASDPPVAKGLAKFSEGTLKNGKYSITIKLQKPNKPEETNPNKDTGPWSGTARYFSITICPEEITADKVNVIHMKASMSQLNKGKANCDWEKLLDLRKLGYFAKIQDLYDGIIVKDPDIKGDK